MCDVWNNDTLNIIYASHLSTRAGAQWGGGGGGAEGKILNPSRQNMDLGRKKTNI